VACGVDSLRLTGGTVADDDHLHERFGALDVLTRVDGGDRLWNGSTWLALALGVVLEDESFEKLPVLIRPNGDVFEIEFKGKKCALCLFHFFRPALFTRQRATGRAGNGVNLVTLLCSKRNYD
jgi:hypothetical protein